jgi:hypothetical protein
MARPSMYEPVYCTIRTELGTTMRFTLRSKDCLGVMREFVLLTGATYARMYSNGAELVYEP